MNEAEGIDPGVGERVNAAIRLAEELGAEVGETSLPRSVDYGLACYYLVAPAEASSNLARYDGVRYGHRADGDGDLTELYSRTRWEGFGAEPKRRILLGTYALSAGYYDAYYGQAQKVRTVIAQGACRRVRAVRRPRQPDLADGRLPRSARRTANPLAMYLSDLLTIPSEHGRACPGLSIPCGLSEGLPVGLQLIGPQFSENTALPRRPRARAGDRLRLRPGAAPMTRNGWEAVIGLEIHVQLKTRTKMFCRCENVWGEEPNTRTCPICLAHPGDAARPEPHGDRVDGQARPRPRLRDRRARALPPQELLLPRPAEGVPDLPVRRAARVEGASSSPGRTAIARSGSCAPTWRRTRRRRSTSAARPAASTAPTLARRLQPRRHAARRDRGPAGRSLRRGGAAVPAAPPPDRRRARDLGRGDGEGLASLRRQRLRPQGRRGRLRTKTELKNMNSFKFVADGIAAEVERQIGLYEAGQEVVQQTLHFDPQQGTIAPLRSKEEAARLPLLPRAGPRRGRAPCGDDRAARAEIGELPGARIRRLEDEVGLRPRRRAS